MVQAWPTGRRRWTGPILFAWLIVLCVSGYLLYYASDDGPWALVSRVHWIAGLALPSIYAAHRLIIGLRRRRP